MDRSYPYSRRLLSRARLHKRMAAVLGAGLAGMAVLFTLEWDADPISAHTQLPLLAVADAAPAGEPGQAGVRRVYPYSVVPGGVSGQAELARVVRIDRVVAAHYASFNVDKARAVVVDKPRAVHVSYRKGDKVYWTAHKVMLAPGETLLSDGRNEMRARCANRISDLPQYPVEDHAPTMEVLDEAVELGAGEGEQYALGPDGLLVSMPGNDANPRHMGQRTPGATPSRRTYASSATDGGLLPTMSLSGSSRSARSEPRPAASSDTVIASDPAPLTGSVSADASAGATAPSSGITTPASQAGGEVPATTPQPETGMPPLPGIELPPVLLPVPDEQPGGPQSGGGASGEPGQQALLPPGSGPLFPERDTVTEAFIPTPDMGPTRPPTDIEQPAPPADVLEPGSIWLGGAALAAMLGLRRRHRPAVLRPESSVPPPPPAAP
ncbi:hypothetical protein [Massilia sp. LjRoot122]|uniref:hypothetical protein n=1 Tax=Massilia sp. LjRoot122 TaxID=3342257 RepID=UPI003ECE1876